MSTSDGPAGPGGATLFWLSALILGGLLFGAGVMVGRGMNPGAAQDPADPLAHLDERDQGPAPKADADLTFPDALSGPPTPPASTVQKTPIQKTPIQKTQPAPRPAPDAGPTAAKTAPPPADAPKAEPGTPGPSYCLQVASFRERQQADELAERLKASGLPEVRTVSGEVDGKGMYYRVRLGRFADHDAAERFRSSNDLKGLIIRAE